MSIYTTPCSVSAAERAYHHAQAHADHISRIREEQINERAEQLLTTEFCPFDGPMFLEAISEIDLVGPAGATLQQLTKAMTHANYEEIGRVIAHQIMAYCAEQALEKAKKDVTRLRAVNGD